MSDWMNEWKNEWMNERMNTLASKWVNEFSIMNNIFHFLILTKTFDY